jgi:signal peptidase I
LSLPVRSDPTSISADGAFHDADFHSLQATFIRAIPWIAALFSLALPGLGQFYNGEPQQGVLVVSRLRMIGCFPGVTIAALYVPAVLMLPLLLIKRRADARHLGRCDRRCLARGGAAAGLYPPRMAGQRLLCRVVSWPACACILMLIAEVRQHMVQTFNIPTAAMQPGILRGDWLFADKRYNCPGCKTR